MTPIAFGLSFCSKFRPLERFRLSPIVEDHPYRISGLSPEALRQIELALDY